ncbi:MAG: helix-turn-helix domain-containing protein [Planctomycetota bacterium]|jgi:hypothetical protein
MNKSKLVESHLRSGKTLTSLEAIEMWGVTRLAAIIHTLRKEYNISTTMIKVPDRFGNECEVAEYLNNNDKSAR